MSGPAEQAHDDQGDGRLRRGRASRAAILDGAARVIRTEGIDALTHRSAAAAAGVPLARVSYHFSTVDELAVAAAGHFLAAFHNRLEELAESSRAGERTIIDACTQFMVELVADGREEFVAAVGVRLALHRRGLVIDDARFVSLITSFGADPTRAAAIFAAMFGFATLAATEPEPVDRELVRAYVHLILESMT